MNDGLALEKILIVDDEDSIRNQLRWGLAEEYEVHTAGSAEEARRILREEAMTTVVVGKPASATATGTVEP